MGEADLRLELRCKNAKLWHVVFDECETVAAFCRSHNLRNGAVGDLLKFTKSPYCASGMRRATLCKLAQWFVDYSGYSADELFPAHLYANNMPKMLVFERESAGFLPLSAARFIAAPAGEEDARDPFVRDRVAIALSTLTPREQQVVEERFGFVGEQKTREAIGAELGVSKDRISQIEAKALRKLRHPSRGPSLRACL